MTNYSLDEVPAWPEVTAYIEASGHGRIVYGENSFPLYEFSAQAARDVVSRFVTAEIAQKLGRPVRLQTVDDMGQWDLVIFPDGTLRDVTNREPASPAPEDAVAVSAADSTPIAGQNSAMPESEPPVDQALIWGGPMATVAEQEQDDSEIDDMTVVRHKAAKLSESVGSDVPATVAEAEPESDQIPTATELVTPAAPIDDVAQAPVTEISPEDVLEVDAEGQSSIVAEPALPPVAAATPVPPSPPVAVIVPDAPTHPSVIAFPEAPVMPATPMAPVVSANIEVPPMAPALAGPEPAPAPVMPPLMGLEPSMMAQEPPFVHVPPMVSANPPAGVSVTGPENYLAQGAAISSEPLVLRPITPAEAPSFLNPSLVEAPATKGVRGILTKAGIKTAPSEAERSERADRTAVSQHWPGSRTVAIVNGKGGSNKTPTTALLAAAFARNGGSGVLAWDNNETRGTLGWRTEQGPHAAHVLDLLPMIPELLATDAQLARIDSFVHHQTVDRFAVLRSNPELLAHVSRLSAEDFDAIHGLTQRYFRLVFIDSGNDESSENWQRMIDRTDQIVVATTTRAEHAEAGRLLLDALARRDEHSARLAAGAVVVVSQADKEEADAGEIASGFNAFSRAAVTIPYDRAMRSPHLAWEALQPATERAWLAAAAQVAAGL